MIHKDDILKMAKHVFKRSQSVPDRRLMHPRREWSIILTLCLLLLIAGAAVSAERFLYFLSLETNLEETPQSVVVYQSGTLQRSLQFYQDRTQIFETLSAEAAPASQPEDLLESLVATSSDEFENQEATEVDEATPSSSPEVVAE